jgi:preprotein translocase subunit SecE
MQLYLYKKGQGYYTRLWGAIACFALAAIGSYRLYQILTGTTNNPWVYTIIPAALLAAITILIYWLQNRPKVADFLITSESELKKVTWSSKDQIITSTIVVLAVVVILAILLGGIDVIFRLVFTKMGLYS